MKKYSLIISIICFLMGFIFIGISFDIESKELILPDLICTKTDVIINLKEDNFSDNCFACTSKIEDCARVSLCKQCKKPIGVVNKCENCGSFDFIYMYKDYLEDNNLSFKSIKEFQNNYKVDTTLVVGEALYFVIGIIFICFGMYKVYDGNKNGSWV